jgi:L,D-peptidoglycan transpeptidase YkuD (ErfK/YbiS/YcfS/YnhG family)
MESPGISDTYKTAPRDRPVSAIRIRAAAGNPRLGWLTAGGQTVPVALGRGGIRANKREGDGGTPKGTFRPRRLWWRADRHLYDFIVEIDHNSSPRIAGRGSAVFLHLARENFSPTAGCVSMTKSAMLRLLQRLGPQTKIVIG